MTRQQRTGAYAGVLFILLWGIDLLNMLKFGTRPKWSELFNGFTVSGALYILGTLLATRWLLRRTQQRRALLLAGLPALVIAFVLLRYGLEELLAPALIGYHNYNPGTPFLFYFLDNIYYAMVYIVLGALIYFADEAIAARRRQSELLEQGREAELAFLRAQVNPHFLFNSLNNIYALSYKGSPRAPEAILKLAELMRYMLYEKKPLLPLPTEWDYVQHFIALQQLRYDYPVAVEIRSGGTMDLWEVPPYLLIAFVENAFKHGDFQGKPLLLELTAGAGELRFGVQNAVGRHQKDAGGGIGLQNLQRRLELLYPDKHQLHTEEKNGSFTVSLTLSR